MFVNEILYLIAGQRVHMIICDLTLESCVSLRFPMGMCWIVAAKLCIYKLGVRGDRGRGSTNQIPSW